MSKSELTKEQIHKIKQVIGMMQLCSDLLKEADPGRQTYIGSESQRLFDLSTQLIERYDLISEATVSEG